MDDLITRIRAAIDEDERVLDELERQLADHGEHMEGGWSLWGRFGDLAERFVRPKRWRAELASRRAILDEHAPDEDGGCVGCGFGNDERRMVEDVGGCPMLLALAKGYGIEPWPSIGDWWRQ